MIYYCDVVNTNTEKDAYSVSFPEFEGVYSQGNSKEHALETAKKTLQDVIKSRIDNNGNIPPTVNRTDEGLYPIELDENIVQSIVQKQKEILRKKMLFDKGKGSKYFPTSNIKSHNKGAQRQTFSSPRAMFRGTRQSSKKP